MYDNVLKYFGIEDQFSYGVNKKGEGNSCTVVVNGKSDPRMNGNWNFELIVQKSIPDLIKRSDDRKLEFVSKDIWYSYFGALKVKDIDIFLKFINEII